MRLCHELARRARHACVAPRQHRRRWPTSVQSAPIGASNAALAVLDRAIAELARAAARGGGAAAAARARDGQARRSTVGLERGHLHRCTAASTRSGIALIAARGGGWRRCSPAGRERCSAIGPRPALGAPAAATESDRSHPADGRRCAATGIVGPPRRRCRTTSRRVVDGIPVTSPSRGRCSTSRRCSTGAELERALNEAEVRGLTDRGLAADLLERYPRRRGARTLRALLESRRAGRDHAERLRGGVRRRSSTRTACRGRG